MLNGMNYHSVDVLAFVSGASEVPVSCFYASTAALARAERAREKRRAPTSAEQMGQMGQMSAWVDICHCFCRILGSEPIMPIRTKCQQRYSSGTGSSIGFSLDMINVCESNVMIMMMLSNITIVALTPSLL